MNAILRIKYSGDHMTNKNYFYLGAMIASVIAFYFIVVKYGVMPY